MKENKHEYTRKGWLLWLPFLLPLFFGYSYFLISGYIAGDQLFYRDFYEASANLNFNEAYLMARWKLGSSEPLSIFLLWMGSNLGIEKDIYITIYNVFLLFLVFCLCRKFHAGMVVFLFLVVNYYLIVLMTGAERLKFGYIFLLMAFLAEGKIRVLLIGCSMFAHFQMILLVPSVLMAVYHSALSRAVSSFRVKKNILYVTFASVLLAALLMWRFHNAILSKLEAYTMGGIEITSFFGFMVLTAIALISTNNWRRMLYCLLPFLVYITIVGEDRVNMIAVTFVVGMLLFEKRLARPFPMILLAYFAFKSVGFVRNIVVYGDGFV